MMTAAFYVELDGGGAVQRVVGENVTVMDNGALNAIVSAARAQGKTSGVIRGESLRFLIQGSRIAFADRAGEIASLTSLLKPPRSSAFLACSPFLASACFSRDGRCVLSKNHGGSSGSS